MDPERETSFLCQPFHIIKSKSKCMCLMQTIPSSSTTTRQCKQDYCSIVVVTHLKSTFILASQRPQPIQHQSQLKPSDFFHPLPHWRQLQNIIGAGDCMKYVVYRKLQRADNITFWPIGVDFVGNWINFTEFYKWNYDVNLVTILFTTQNESSSCSIL